MVHLTSFYVNKKQMYDADVISWSQTTISDRICKKIWHNGVESVVHEINIQIHFRNINASFAVFLAWEGAGPFLNSLIDKVGH